METTYTEILTSYTAPRDELQTVIDAAEDAVRGRRLLSEDTRRALDALEATLAEESGQDDVESADRVREAEQAAIDALKADDAAIEAMESARCECGSVCSNSGCGWTGSEDETVVVEWMPAYLRESHRAAGNSGVYPHNGAQQSRLERSCAEAVCAADPDWCRIVE